MSNEPKEHSSGFMAQDRTKVDLIYRQAAIDAASCECNELRGVFGRIEKRLKALPSAEEESFEWCYTCKEYDQEKHCCHRWTKVIRNTVEELQSAQPEYNLDEWCTDCKEYDHERHCCPRFNHVIRTTLQEVQAERKVGKWVIVTDSRGQHAECQYCGEWKYHSKQKFCGECGAQMEVEER